MARIAISFALHQTLLKLAPDTVCAMPIPANAFAVGTGLALLVAIPALATRPKLLAVASGNVLPSASVSVIQDILVMTARSDALDC